MLYYLNGEFIFFLAPEENGAAKKVAIKPLVAIKKPVNVQFCIAPEGGFITTPEGVMQYKTGDYIIRGVNGEIYPCQPDIFEKTYEVVDAKSKHDTGG